MYKELNWVMLQFMRNNEIESNIFMEQKLILQIGKIIYQLIWKTQLIKETSIGNQVFLNTYIPTSIVC